MRIELCNEWPTKVADNRRFSVTVRNDGRGRLGFYRTVQGSPFEIQRLLPSIQHSVKKLSGKARREALNKILDGFGTWKQYRNA